MTKTIDTLVEDIYAVLENGIEETESTEELINSFGEAMANMLRRRLYQKEEYTPSLRLSAIGQCETKQYYNINTDEPKEELKGPTLLKFMVGDITEEVTLSLAKLSGHEVRGEQDEIRVEDIVGHRDAVIDGYTVDVKSASARAFEKFANGTLKENDSFGYCYQLGAYTVGADDVEQDAAYFLAFHKELGKLALMKLDAEEFPNVKKRCHELKDQMELPFPPPRPYEPRLANKVSDPELENYQLPVTCSYCAFKFKCWEDSNDGEGLRTFIYSNGPRYLTKVGKVPNVEEVLR